MFWELLQRIFNNIFGFGMHLPQCVSLRVSSCIMDLRLTITSCVRIRISLCACHQPATSTAPFFQPQSSSSLPSTGFDPARLVPPASRVISPSMRSLKPLGYLNY
ncbi:uncharacterized protein LOC113390855 [Ctenocephalides felis]|uniref:uncharacterized protein LOC113390855 n=1 Tax=Ctenocephalides felis TaxID=7515 RepID=UPI000E6E13EF|nr:uncharacterized protein LOC113390855 [Ctenocephalides felis]